ncbi:MAG: ATP-binding protein [Proteobacteria bacterium]|nr:ATP-binding protein [Pseudomonadota bacterium]
MSMSQNSKPVANIYNPLNQDKQCLLDNFVIRQREFDKIFAEIKSGRLNHASQNFIIQGQRGTGKTTLLAKLRYEIQDAGDLSHLIAIQFTEEQYHIFSLNRLWENVADILEEKEGFEKIVDEMEDLEDNEDFFFLIQKYLKKNKQKLVLLMDNFGDILDKLSGKEHKKLRDILHETDLQIIAGSTRTLETAYKHDKPFFESFKTIYLGPLSQADVQVLLKNLCRQYHHEKAFNIIQNEKGRIEAIRRLTGGIPRTIILLFEIFLDDSATVFEDLENILDRITPLYKHKMDDLATQQQVIVDALAMNWDGMLTAEIAQKTRYEPKNISAQMKTLEKSGFVRSVLVNKKNKLYLLDERFFNIWYLMRYGRKKKKQQVKWLVSFLKEWCTREELAHKAQHHIALAREGKLHQRGAYCMAEALSQSVREASLQYEVLSQTKEMLFKTSPEMAGTLSNADATALERATEAYQAKDFKRAEEYCIVLAEQGDAGAMYNLAFLYEESLKEEKKAEKYCLMAVGKDFKENMSGLMNTGLSGEKEKNTFFNLIKRCVDETNVSTILSAAVMAIHCQEYKESVEFFRQLLDLIKGEKQFQHQISNYFVLLISRKQYQLALALFQEEKYLLKELIRPVFYALMFFMQDAYPKEFKRMGEELRETVDEVVVEIKRLSAGQEAD